MLVPSALMMFPFLNVAQHESRIGNAVFCSMTVYNKTLCSQYNFTAHKEQVQKKRYYVGNRTMIYTSMTFFSFVKDVIPICGSDINYQTSTINLGAKWEIPSYIKPIIRSAFCSIDRKFSIGGNYWIFYFYFLFCTLFCSILYFTHSLLFL